MADEGDLAKDWAERQAEDALETWRRGRPAGASLTECEECGEPIPEKRRQAAPGCTRCVECQMAAEAELKRGARG